MSAEIEGIGYSGSQTYSTNSPQTIHSFTFPVNSGGIFVVHVVARRVSDGAVKTFDFAVSAKRSNGDAVVFGGTLVRTQGTVADLLALVAVSIDVDALDADVRLRVIGLASTEIDWAFSFAGEAVKHIA